MTPNTTKPELPWEQDIRKFQYTEVHYALMEYFYSEGYTGSAEEWAKEKIREIRSTA